MGVESDAGSGMQFDQVEAPGSSGPPACGQCRRPLDEYFALGGHMFCGTCVDVFKRGGSFWLALLFGTGAAALGGIVWYAVSAASGGSSYGLIGIVVGLAVGFAVRKGARGRGGWKFQALAMALTYLAITTSYVPLIIKEVRSGAHHKADGGGTAAQTDSAQAEADEPADAQTPPPPRVSGGQRIIAYLFVFGFALVLPFLGATGFIGWIIIAIALYEAWKLNKRVPITGPFRFGGALSVPAPAPVMPSGMPPAGP